MKIKFSLLMVTLLLVACNTNVDSKKPDTSDMPPAPVPDQGDENSYVSMPDFVSDNPDIQKQLTNWIENITAKFEENAMKNGPLANGQKYELIGKSQLFTHFPFESYVLMFSEDAGGASPAEYVESKTFETSSAKVVDLSKLFTTDDYLTKISDIVRATFNDVTDAEMFEVGTEPTVENFDTWALDKERIIFFFDSMQIGPKSDGMQKTSINLYDLEPWLDSEILRHGTINDEEDTDMKDSMESNTVTIEAKTDEGTDYLNFSVDDMIIPVKLSTHPGQIQAHETKGGDDTIALFYSYWAGSGDIFRVRHTGLKLTVEQMSVSEPSEEFGMGCEDWKQIAQVEIGLKQDFIVQPGKSLEEYQPVFDCDCVETGDGSVCGNM